MTRIVEEVLYCRRGKFESDEFFFFFFFQKNTFNVDLLIWRKTLQKRENVYFVYSCAYVHVVTRAVASKMSLFRPRARNGCPTFFICTHLHCFSCVHLHLLYTICTSTKPFLAFLGFSAYKPFLYRKKIIRSSWDRTYMVPAICYESCF